MSFDYHIAQEDGVAIVRLAGRLDSATAGAFEKPLLELFQAPGSRVLMDFQDLEYISSAGLRVVLMAAKRAKQSPGVLVLCALAPQVRDVFEISGFLKILEAVADRDSALARLHATA